MQQGKGPVLVISTPQGQLGNSLVHFAHIRAFAIRYKIPLLHLTFDSYAELFPQANTDLFSAYSAGQDLRANPLVSALLGVFRTFLSLVAQGDAAGAAREQILSTPLELLLSSKDPELRHSAFIFGCALTRWIEAGQLQSVPTFLLRASDSGVLTLSRDPRMQTLLTEERLVLLDGWLIRDDEALSDHATEIRSYFTPTPSIMAEVDRVMSGLRSSADIVVGVHIRRRDYKEFMEGRYYWPVERYLAWMREIVGALPGRRVGFLVCSDEPLPVEQFAEFRFSPGPGSAITDMYSFARCDLVLGPPSTFTHWASFWGGNKVFYMQSAEDSALRVVEELPRT